MNTQHIPRDPSENVRQALSAEVKRLDDMLLLRIASSDCKLDAEIKRIDEKITLQANAAALLNSAESKRLDAIRLVDISAVAVASDRAAQQALVLANQVESSAENLRTLVASTAATVAQQSAQQSAQLSDRILALEKSNYEGVGRGRILDPQMDQLLIEVKNLSGKQHANRGSSEGMKNLWIIILGIVSAVSTIILIYFSLRH